MGAPPVPENLQLGHDHWTQPELYVHETPALSSPCSATDAQAQAVFHGQLPCPKPPRMRHQQGVTSSSANILVTSSTDVPQPLLPPVKWVFLQWGEQSDLRSGVALPEGRRACGGPTTPGRPHRELAREGE